MHKLVRTHSLAKQRAPPLLLFFLRLVILNCYQSSGPAWGRLFVCAFVSSQMREQLRRVIQSIAELTDAQQQPPPQQQQQQQQQSLGSSTTTTTTTAAASSARGSSAPVNVHIADSSTTAAAAAAASAVQVRWGRRSIHSI